MKKIILTILLIVGYSIQAQQQELIENTWYLEKIVFGGDEFLTPNNEEVTQVPFFYFETIGDSYSFKTRVCQEVRTGGQITDSHLFFDTSAYNSNCAIQANTDFQFLYFDDFLHAGLLNTFEYPYEIVEEPGYLRLIINPDAEITAYYNNQILSTSDINSIKPSFQITFQNEDLIIQSSSLTAKSVFIYDLSGKLVLTSDVQHNRIQTYGIPKGIYLIKITDDKGITHSKKLRKQ